MLAADLDFWVSKPALIFVNTTFGTPSVIVGSYTNAPVFPNASFGARALFQLSDEWLIRVAVQDADAGGILSDNRHGYDVDFGDGVLAIGELEWSRPNENAPADDFKVSVFHDGADIVDEDGTLESSAWGVAALIDRQIAPDFTWFARALASQSERSIVPFEFETGVVAHAAFGGPGNLGLGVGYIGFNDRLGELLGVPDREHEIVVEATYEWPIGDHFVVQPDLQYIVTPGGSSDAEDALVVGLRMKLNLSF
jgi:porin